MLVYIEQKQNTPYIIRHNSNDKNNFDEEIFSWKNIGNSKYSGSFHNLGKFRLDIRKTFFVERVVKH